MNLRLTKKKAIAIVIILAALLNFTILYFTYPLTFTPESDIMARDFSAYYTGEWRLFHNPTKIYFDGALPVDHQIPPASQPFKYTPSFLILFAPFLTLDYQDALNFFNIIQFYSIAIMGFFVYKLVEEKNIFLAISVAIIVILNPILYAPSIAYDSTAFLHTRMTSLHYQTFSPSYYCGYLLGNAHILQTALLVGALYFGFSKKPWASALLFAFGVFDPRAALFALPLLLWFNRKAIKKFIAAAAIFLTATNLPFFFYQGIGFSFLQTETRGSIISQMYLYDWLPLYAVAALSTMEIITQLHSRRIHFRHLFSRSKNLFNSQTS